MTGYSAAGRRVDLGAPDLISDPTTRDAYIRTGEMSAKRQSLMRDQIVADDRLRDAINAKPEGVADALWAGEAIDDDMDADAVRVESLRAEAARLSKLVAAAADAERIGVVKLNEALDAAAPDIAKASLRKLSSLPAKLAMVDRVLAEVMDAHDSTAGMIHLLEERTTQGGALTLRHIAQTPRVELGLAQEHVRQAVAKLAREIEAAKSTLKPLKAARKGKKTDAAPEATSEAHSAAQTASVPTTVEAFDITAGEDDD